MSDEIPIQGHHICHRDVAYCPECEVEKLMRQKKALCLQAARQLQRIEDLESALRSIRDADVICDAAGHARYEQWSHDVARHALESNK